MILAVAFLLLPALPYCQFLLRCIRAWKRPLGQPETDHFPNVTVVIPVRNEAGNILRLLESLDMQTADPTKVDIIVVDDHSKDDTPEIVKKFMERGTRFPGRLIRLSDTFSKKSAVAAAVNATSAEWIVTIDADVQLPAADWLESMMHHTPKDVWMLCGPVLIDGPQKSLVPLLARLESIGLMSIAGAGIRSGVPLFCNGANLAFRREKFLALGGYDFQRLSGDDTDLLHRFPPQHIRFLDDHACMLHAAAPYTWSAFISQRHRWASKIPDSLAKTLLKTGLSAWWTHFVLLLVLGVALVRLIPFGWVVLLFSLKAFIEYQVLKASQKVHLSRVPGGVILLLQPLYCALIVIIGFLSVSVAYRWKDRVS